jgi:hypothetical protein
VDPLKFRFGVAETKNFAKPFSLLIWMRFRVLADKAEEIDVSIVRVGLAETKKFAEGYETIFGKKKSGESKKTKAVAKNSAAKKKKKTSKKK